MATKAQWEASIKAWEAYLKELKKWVKKLPKDGDVSTSDVGSNPPTPPPIPPGH